MGATVAQPTEAGHPRSLIPIPGPVGFIGMGKVGTALASLLHSRGVAVAGVSGREPASARHMAHEAGLDPATALPRSATVAASGIVFLTVPDDAIGPLCEEIAANEGWGKGQFVVHCSGALTSEILAPATGQGALVASFHPLQAFADVHAAIANMPGSAFGIEGDAPVVDVLARFAELLGGKVLHLTPEQKTLYHAAATIASNYTVTLAALASRLLVEAGVAADSNAALAYLLPLLRGPFRTSATLVCLPP